MRTDIAAVARSAAQQVVGARPAALGPQRSFWGWVRAALAFQPAHPVVAPAPSRSVLREGLRGSRVKARAEPAELDRSIFVVYGRDDNVSGAVFQLLRKLDLKPLEWASLVRGSQGGMTPMLSDVVANAPRLASAVVVVLTPDDMVMLHPGLRRPREEAYELRPTLQPRPDVLVELGLVLGMYPERTLILEFGELRPIAELNRRNSVRFHHSTPLVETLRSVAARLQEAGLPVDDTGSDWLDPSPFEDLDAYGRRPN